MWRLCYSSLFYNGWKKGLGSEYKEDSGDAQIAGKSVGGLGKGENPLAFIPLWTDLKWTNQCQNIFLESVLLAIQISNGAKEQPNGMRKGFQAHGYSLALLFITAVLRLFHCVNIIHNRKSFKKNLYFKKRYSYIYEVIWHHNVHHVCMEKKAEV